MATIAAMPTTMPAWSEEANTAAANSSGASLNTIEDFVMTPAAADGGASVAAANGVTTRSRVRESAVLAMVEELRMRPKSFDHLPPEVYCRILQYLSVVELIRVTAVNKQFRAAVTKHLRLTKRINFCSGLPFTFLSESLDDATLASVLTLCPEVTHILGFYPRRIFHRSSGSQQLQQQQSGAYYVASFSSSVSSASPNSTNCNRTRCLTYNGILQALKQCKKLKSIEIMDVDLMSRILATFPRVKFHGMFRNRPDIWDCERAYDGPSPLPSSLSKLLLSPQINSLTKVDLQSVCLNALPKMECVRYLYLKWVRFSGNDPFANFSAPKLQTFVMNNCVGPSNAFRYLRVFSAVARASQLARLELTGLRFISGLVEHMIDDFGGDSRAFRALQKLSLSGNKSVTEIDAGSLLLAASSGLGCAALQSSLCKDSLFVALSFAQASFPKLDTLTLGYRDPCPDLDRSQFSVEPTDPHCQITDYGMTYVGRSFANLTNLTVSRAPFLSDPTRWLDQPLPIFAGLRCLTLESCHCIAANRLADLIAVLSGLEMLVLRDMFAPTPRACDYLGLAAGQQWAILPQGAPTRDSIQGFFVANPPAGRLLAAFPNFRHRLFGGLEEHQPAAAAAASVPAHSGSPDSSSSLSPGRAGHTGCGLSNLGADASANQSSATCSTCCNPHGCGGVLFYSRGAQTSVLQLESPASSASTMTSASPLVEPAAVAAAAAAEVASRYRLRSRGGSVGGAGAGVVSETSLACRISADQPEPGIMIDQRDHWLARDVCLDTHDLRLFEPLPPSPLVLRSSTALHAVHIERCGLTLIDCSEATRLRTLTVESCPRLAEIRLPSGSARSLRRLRIVGCPRFDYRLLYRRLVDVMAARCTEPREGFGDDSLAVCFRPMGAYHSLDEQILLKMPGSHLLLTHDFMGSDARDINLDRLQSHFHQIFRDIMHFSENLIRRDYVKESRPGDPIAQSNRFSRGRMLRFESGRSSDGHPWDLLTDIPWVGECGINPYPNFPEDADQLYQTLIESHSMPYYKMASRGLSVHVQCRDIDKFEFGNATGVKLL